MSAACVKLIAILCLYCTVPSSSESRGVVWRDVGGSITIHCRTPKPNQELLILKKGLKRDFEVYFRESKSKDTIAEKFTDRLRLDGVFPNMDIEIKNLTSDDTGPFWCEYKRFDMKIEQATTEEGIGSVLLVVTDAAHPCDQPKGTASTNLVLVSVVISAALLLGIIICFLIWFIPKANALRTTVKPRRVPNNDVYEDMRGTVRR